MTANEIKSQKVSNMRLLWLIYGHKIQNTAELANFTKKELKDIYHVEDRQLYKLEIVVQLLAKGMTEDEVKLYLA